MSTPIPAPDFLEISIALATRNVPAGGGPFGAVVELADGFYFPGRNGVVPDSDPTAHAEVVAIRAAAKFARTHELTGATLYTSCFPCPMCLGAILWARISRVVYAASPDEAAAAGFDDARFYSTVGGVAELFGRPRGEAVLELSHEPRLTRLAPFDAWRAHTDRTDY